MQKRVEEEKLEVVVVSYGGACTNALVAALEKEGYVCSTETWKKKLCHSLEYLSWCSLPIIYIYDNPKKALLSVRRRQLQNTNQRKMMANLETKIKCSSNNLLKLMIMQFHNWTDIKRDNVLILHANELFTHEIVDKLSNFLHKKVTHFPIKYKKPKTDLNKVDAKTRQLFHKYRHEIKKINSFSS